MRRLSLPRLQDEFQYTTLQYKRQYNLLLYCTSTVRTVHHVGKTPLSADVPPLTLLAQATMVGAPSGKPMSSFPLFLSAIHAILSAQNGRCFF